MTVHERATIIPLPGRTPHLPESALVMPGAVIAGAVSLGERVGIWPGASLRAEEEPITVGDDSNVQDSCSLHVDHGSPLRIGARVSIGHNAVVHGCTVEDDVLIGMHATVMNGAVIGAGSIIAAGALVTEGTVVPEHSLVAGVPGKVRRETTEEERRGIERNAEVYSKRIQLYVDAIRTR
jgi:carbonic anhydrase/acetyltransferase-like protein (isoleucine patch superfamily)